MPDIQASSQLYAPRHFALFKNNEIIPPRSRQERQLILFCPTLLTTLINLAHLFNSIWSVLEALLLNN